MGVSWKFDNFRYRLLYAGTWTGDRRFDFGIMLCMLGVGSELHILFGS